MHDALLDTLFGSVILFFLTSAGFLGLLLLTAVVIRGIIYHVLYALYYLKKVEFAPVWTRD